MIIGAPRKNKAKKEVENKRGAILAGGNCIGAIGQMSEWSRGASNGDTRGKNVPARVNGKYKCPVEEERLQNKNT